MTDNDPHEAPATGAPQDPPEDLPVHAEVRYQQTDINLPWILFVLISILASFAMVGVAGWWLLDSARVATGHKPGRADYAESDDPLPTDPRIESLDGEPGRVTEVFARQIQLESELHTYGRLEGSEFVRVPIDQAIEVAAMELAGREEMPDSFNKGYGLVSEGDANSGRLYREAPSWLEQ